MNGSLSGWVGLIAAVLFLSIAAGGCLSPKVQTQVDVETDLSGFRSVYVAEVIARDEALPANDPLLDQLATETSEHMNRNGFETAPPDEADLGIQIQVQTETVARRSWSSDPDANAYVMREFPEAILAIQVIERRSGGEVWKAAARSRLPNEEWIVGPSVEQVWMNLLARVLDRIPSRSGTPSEP